MPTNDEARSLELSRRLVYLSAERTLSSWIRAALSLMALGFVIDRFGLLLHSLPLAPGHEALYPRVLSTWAGAILIGMGALMSLAAGIRYLRFAITFHRDGSTPVRHGVMVGAWFAFLLALFGVLLIVLLVAILE